MSSKYFQFRSKKRNGCGKAKQTKKCWLLEKIKVSSKSSENFLYPVKEW